MQKNKIVGESDGDLRIRKTDFLKISFVKQLSERGLEYNFLISVCVPKLNWYVYGELFTDR